MRYIVNNRNILKKEGLSRKEIRDSLDDTVVNMNSNKYYDYDYEDVNNGEIQNYNYNEPVTPIRMKKVLNQKQLRNDNYQTYKEFEDVFLTNITNQIFDETYRIINNVNQTNKNENYRLNKSLLTNDEYTNNIIEMVGNDNDEYLDLIATKPHRVFVRYANINDAEFNGRENYYNKKQYNDQEINNIEENSISNQNQIFDRNENSIKNDIPPPPPIIGEVKNEDIFVDTNKQNSSINQQNSSSSTKQQDTYKANINSSYEQKVTYKENKLPPSEYERLRKEINDYENHYNKNLIVAGSSPLSVSDAVDVNLYKNWYLNHDELFDARRKQDKKLDDLVYQYEQILRKQKILDAQEEINEFKNKLDSEIKHVNEQNELLNSEIAKINNSNSIISNENESLKGEIKDLRQQLKTNFEKQVRADAVRKSLVEKIMNQTRTNNVNNLSNNYSMRSSISLSQVKTNAIDSANGQPINFNMQGYNNIQNQNNINNTNNSINTNNNLNTNVGQTFNNQNRLNQIANNTLNNFKDQTQSQESLNNALNNNVNNKQNSVTISSRQQVLNSFQQQSSNNETISSLNNAINSKRNNLFQSFNMPNQQSNVSANVDVKNNSINLKTAYDGPTTSLSDALKNKRN